MAANHRQFLAYDAAFIAEQIREVDSYVTSGQDPQEVIQRVEHVKAKEQFFYAIAEENAKNYRGKIEVLGRYILFIFSFVQARNYTNEYMILVFLDTLLPPVDGMNNPTWMALDGYVRSRAAPGIVSQWDEYVRRLGLSGARQGGAGSMPRSQPKLSSPQRRHRK